MQKSLKTAAEVLRAQKPYHHSVDTTEKKPAAVEKDTEMEDFQHFLHNIAKDGLTKVSDYHMTDGKAQMDVY